jgi:hypothetical protein
VNILNKQMKIKSLLKAGIISIVLVITAFTNLTMASPSISNCEEAADYVVSQLSIDKDEVLIHVWGPIEKGVEVSSTLNHIIDAPERGYVIYIDLYPQANLFHPVKYVFLSEDTDCFIVIDDESSPINYFDYKMIDTEIGEIFKSAYNRRAPLSGEKPKLPLKEKSDSRYAVLMNGGHSSGNNHVRYWNDLSNIYITLVDVYGYLDENIIVLCSDGLDPAADQSNGQNSDPDLDGDGDDDIMYSCVLENVELVFEELAETMSGGGELFVFATDHGNTQGGYDSIFNLWNMEELEDNHFADLLADISASEIVCTFEPCFSGGFLDDVVVPPGPIVASTACRHDEYSWAMGNLLYDEYVFYWTAAVKGEDAFGEPVDADYNEDGEVTMDEAFIFAEEHDEASEEPQYGEYPEGTGALCTLWPGSQEPGKPTTPEGPDQCTEYETVVFSTSATEPDNEDVFYRFDWGDGTLSDWIGPFSPGQTGEASYNWTVTGEYEVKSIAKDINGVMGEWSDPATIIIVENSKPDQPIMTGPKFGTTGKDIEFKVSAVDPDDHDIYYFIRWDDGTNLDWDGPYQSGEEVTFTHQYTEGGSRAIITIAKDIVSEKSQQCTHNIRIINNRAVSRTVNLRLLDIFINHFSNIFERLREIL